MFFVIMDLSELWNKLQESLFYCKTLNEMYPENDLYLAMYVRNLLLMKKYNEAEKLIPALPEEQGNKFFQAQYIILKGIIQEKRYHDNNLALQYYNNGFKQYLLIWVSTGMNMLHMLISV